MPMSLHRHTGLYNNSGTNEYASCLTFGINLLVDDSFYIHGLTSNIIIIPVHEVLGLTSGAIWRGLFGKMATAALEELTGKLVSCWRIFVERRKSVTKTLLALTLERPVVETGVDDQRG